MRKWIIVAVFCWLVAFSAEKALAVNKIIGLVLDFPPGSLDPVTKIELQISLQPDLIPGKNVRYTNMNCDRDNPKDICPGYKDVGNGNYIQYYYDSYTGPALPGGLGNDWQRIEWNSSSEKITYMEGTDTIDSGIIDGYCYTTDPEVRGVALTGYPGRTKVSYFDTGYDVTYIFKFYVWEILVEDDWVLADAVMSLQIMAGIQPPPTQYGPFDINADGKIGMAEAVYIMQKISGRR